MWRINNTAKLADFINEQTEQSKALTDGKIHKIKQIQISILSRCRRPIENLFVDNLLT